MTITSDPATQPTDQLPENQQALLAESLDLGAPLALAAVVATWLSSLEPAARRLSGAAQRRRETHEYVEAALATPGAPVTAALHLVAAMAHDDHLRARAAAEADRRDDDLPEWIHRLTEAALTLPVKTVMDPQRRTATYVFGATFPGATVAAAGEDASEYPGSPDGPPPASLDSLAIIVTTDGTSSPAVPIELLLTPYAPAGLADRLQRMDGPPSNVHTLTTDEARDVLRNVLDGPHRGVGLEEASTSALPLLRWFARSIEA